MQSTLLDGRLVPEHLRQAARRRHESALARANEALADLSSRGAVINFVQVARAAAVSTDFLYREPDLRRRIQQLRTRYPRQGEGASPAEPEASTTNSAAVRALSAQIKELRRTHRKEIAGLKDALAAAQGENLLLRRKLAAYD